MSNQRGSWEARRLKARQDGATGAAKQLNNNGNKRKVQGVLLGLLGVAVAGSLLAMHMSDGSAAEPSASIVGVKYEVEGTAKYGSITLKAPQGTQQQEIDIPLMNKAGSSGLTYSMPSGSFVYLAVQNGQDSGSVTCRITGTDGYTVSEVTSTGAYVIATCEGTAY